jgi:hypothetical protein
LLSFKSLLILAGGYLATREAKCSKKKRSSDHFDSSSLLGCKIRDRTRHVEPSGPYNLPQASHQLFCSQLAYQRVGKVGHWRDVAPYYRCAATRMVRMGSPGPHPTRKARTTPGNSGHSTSQLSGPSPPALLVIRPPQFSLARRKLGAQIPSPLPNLAGQSVASLKPAALTACWAALGAAHRPWKGVRRRLGSGCRSWSTVRATLRLTGSTTCTPGCSLSLLGVQLQSPVGALAERLAQLFAADEPELGGGRVGQP